MFGQQFWATLRDLNVLTLKALLPLNEADQPLHQYFYAEKEFVFDRLQHSLFRNATAMFGFAFAREFLAFGIHRDDYKFAWGKSVGCPWAQDPIDIKLALTKGQSSGSIKMNCYLQGRFGGVDWLVGVASKDQRARGIYGQTEMPARLLGGAGLPFQSAIISGTSRAKTAPKSTPLASKSG